VTYKTFDVVAVPFPFSDSGESKKRPAIVLSSSLTFSNKIGHSIFAMITSARNEPWPLDVEIRDLANAGLPKPSVIRMKFFTLDNNLIVKVLGSLGPKDRIAISKVFKTVFLDLLSA